MESVPQALNFNSVVAYFPNSTNSNICPTSESPSEISSGLPSTGITAVVLNVTIINSSASNGGYLAISPLNLQSNLPTTSSIDYGSNSTVASQVTVGLSATGRAYFLNTLFNNDASRVDILIDVQGYYSDSVGDTYFPITTSSSPIPPIMENSLLSPCIATSGSPVDALPLSNGNNESDIQIAGGTKVSTSSCSQSSTVPLPLSDNANAVLLSITAQDNNATIPAYLTIAPEGIYSSSTTKTQTSVLNLQSGSVPASNTVTVMLGDSNKSIGLVVMSANGNSLSANDVQIEITLVGYYSTDTNGSVYSALSVPQRIANSINCSPIMPSGFLNLPTSTTNVENFKVSDADSINSSCSSSSDPVIPSMISGAVISLAIQDGNSQSYVTIEPGQATFSQTPVVYSSSLSANSLIQTEQVVNIPTSGSYSGNLSLIASPTSLPTSSLKFIIDISGYFVPTSTSPEVPNSGGFYFPLEPARIANTTCSTPQGLSGTFSNATTETYDAPEACVVP